MSKSLFLMHCPSFYLSTINSTENIECKEYCCNDSVPSWIDGSVFPEEYLYSTHDKNIS